MNKCSLSQEGKWKNIREIRENYWKRLQMQIKIYKI